MAIFQMFISLHKYYNLQASTLDLGWYEQALWKVFHGDWWAFATATQTPLLGIDVSFTLFPLAYPFHYLGGAVFLFAVQAVATAFAAWGIFRAARTLGLSEGPAALWAGLFLLFPGIIGGSQFDFHVDFLVLPFVVWAYVYYREKKMTKYYICLLLAALGKDVAVLGVIAWGVGLLLERRWRDGMVALLGGTIIFAAIVGWLLPHVVPGGGPALDYSFYGYLGHGPLGILEGVVTHGSLLLRHVIRNVDYVALIFLPVAFMALLGRAALAPLLALFAFNYLSRFPAQHSYFAQYQVIETGWLYLAAIEGFQRVGSSGMLRLARIATAVAVAATVALEAIVIKSLIYMFILHSSSQLPYVKAAVAHLPKDAVVYTQNRLGPWAYRRRIVGVAAGMGEHDLTDPLPVLWQEARQSFGGTRTAFLTMRPMRPFLAQTVADAMEHGYRISFHAGRVSLLVGNRTFNPPSPAGPWAWQGRPFPLIVPAWTQVGDVGTVSWRHLWLAVGPGPRGFLMEPVLLGLHPGRYTAEFVFAPGPRGGGGVLGEAVATVQGRADPVQTFVRAAQREVRLPFEVPGRPGGQRREVGLGLRSSGRGSLRLLELRVYNR